MSEIWLDIESGRPLHLAPAGRFFLESRRRMAILSVLARASEPRVSPPNTHPNPGLFLPIADPSLLVAVLIRAVYLAEFAAADTSRCRFLGDTW
jgi:hypothetical protein